MVSFSLCVCVSSRGSVGAWGEVCCARAGLRYVELLTYKTDLLPFRHSSREGK